MDVKCKKSDEFNLTLITEITDKKSLKYKSFFY